MRRLLENSDYRNRFINIFSDRLNTIFKSGYLTNRLNSLASRIEPLIPMQQERWPGSSVDWDYHIQIIETFSENRQSYIRQFIRNYFNLPAVSYSLFTVSSQTGPHGGKIQINTITPENYPWGGYYYPNVPIEVTAIADTGYIFSGWAQFPDSSETMKVQIANGFSLTAFFEPYAGGDIFDIVINEINYNSSDEFDTKDWIELYNNGLESAKISGWVFTDENEDHRFTIPDTTVIDSGGYIILAQNVDAFINFFEDAENVLGPFEFGLSGGGELISLFDVSGRLVDQVEYDDSQPWPTEPDGNGPTLELLSPELPNDIAESWSISLGNGTPGYINSVTEFLYEDSEPIVPDEISLFPAFPNPFNSNVKIKFNVPSQKTIEISISNIVGETVRVIKNSNINPGSYIITWDGKNDLGQGLSSGLYFCTLKTDNFKKSIKLLLVQ